MESKNPFTIYDNNNNHKYRVEEVNQDLDEDTPTFQVYDTIEKPTKSSQEQDQFQSETKNEKKRSLTDDGASFLKDQNKNQYEIRNFNDNATTTDSSIKQKNIDFNISPIAKTSQENSGETFNFTRNQQFTDHDQEDEYTWFYLMPDFIEKIVSGNFDLQKQKKQLEFTKDIVQSSNQQHNQSKDNHQYSNSLTSQLKEWGINYKYQVTENKSRTFGGFFSYSKVTFEDKDSFPIYLLNHEFMIDYFRNKRKQDKLELNKQILEQKIKFYPLLYSIIWATYRKNFKPLITEEFRLLCYVENLYGQSKAQSSFVSTDANWGCTLRVGQMLVCNALQRYLFGDCVRIENIIKDRQQSKQYKKILRLINDNDGSSTGAFSIQNIAKMGLVHDKLPGQWYGPNSISVILKDLNKLYQPIPNFQICLYNDGNIYLDKIKKQATKERNIDYLKKHREHKNEMDKIYSMTEFIFLKYVQQQRKYQKLQQTDLSNNKYKQSEQDEERKEGQQTPENQNGINQEQPKWKNSILVIVPTRLGMNKVGKEYFAPILKFFQSDLNVGIIGGKPQGAFYFVGAQQNDLIFLDPHYVQQTVESDKDLTTEHLSYHSASPKKIPISKIDTTLAFGFYLRDYKDYLKFESFMYEGKFVFQDNWPFSIFESKPQLIPTCEPQNHFLPKTQVNDDQQQPLITLFFANQEIKNKHSNLSEKLKSHKTPVDSEEDDYEVV